MSDLNPWSCVLPPLAALDWLSNSHVVFLETFLFCGNVLSALLVNLIPLCLWARSHSLHFFLHDFTPRSVKCVFSSPRRVGELVSHPPQVGESHQRNHSLFHLSLQRQLKQTIPVRPAPEKLRLPVHHIWAEEKTPEHTVWMKSARLPKVLQSEYIQTLFSNRLTASAVHQKEV